MLAQPNNNHLVSVIVFFYNHGASLAKTLRTILIHNNIPVEIIIIVIAAQDRQSQQVIELLEKDPLPDTQILRGDYWSITEAYAAGLALSQGKYTFALFGDSFIPTNYMESIIHAFENTAECGFVYSAYTLYGDNAQKHISLPNYTIYQALRNPIFNIPVVTTYTKYMKKLMPIIVKIGASSQTIWACLHSQGYLGKSVSHVSIYLNHKTFSIFQTMEKLRSHDIQLLPPEFKNSQLTSSLIEALNQ